MLGAWERGFLSSGLLTRPLRPLLPLSPQNLVLPDSFFSFYDLRRQFHAQRPEAGPARDLTVAAMAQSILALPQSPLGRTKAKTQLWLERACFVCLCLIWRHLGAPVCLCLHRTWRHVGSQEA